MKFYHLKNMEGFFKVVESCEGKVELVTNEGDRLNLKSKLCQYISFAKLIEGGEIPEMEIVAYKPEDMMKLLNFMIDDVGRRNIENMGYILRPDGE